MEIRNAETEDVKSIVEIWFEMQSLHSNFDEKYYKLRESHQIKQLSELYFLDSLQKKNHEILVVCDGGRVIAFMHYEYLKRPPIFVNRKAVLIVEVAVTETYRHKGVFTRMFQHLREILEQERVCFVELSVDMKNEIAIEAYKKMGFYQRQQKMILSLGGNEEDDVKKVGELGIL